MSVNTCSTIYYLSSTDASPKISMFPLDPPVDFIDAWLDIRRVAFRLGAASPCGDGEPESTPVDFLRSDPNARPLVGEKHQQIREVMSFGLKKQHAMLEETQKKLMNLNLRL